jgi:hypothetical protein
LFVSHFTEFTPSARQAKEKRTLNRGIRTSPLRIPAADTAAISKNLKFFEMSVQKIFRKGEPNRVNQPKLHMNLVVDAPLSKTPDFSSPFVLFPAPSELGNSGKQPTSRISREAMGAFLNAKSDNAFSAHFSAPPTEPPAAMPEKGLALGVLKQAAHDLRRFGGATRGVKRELYVDAYDWITANDFSWPYSFVNVCKVLNVCPEVVRTELFADASLSWFDYWTKRAGRVSAKLRASFVRVFANCPNPDGAEGSPLASSI